MGPWLTILSKLKYNPLYEKSSKCQDAVFKSDIDIVSSMVRFKMFVLYII